MQGALHHWPRAGGCTVTLAAFRDLPHVHREMGMSAND